MYIYIHIHLKYRLYLLYIYIYIYIYIFKADCLSNRLPIVTKYTYQLSDILLLVMTCGLNWKIIVHLNLGISYRNKKVTYFSKVYHIGNIT